MHICLNNINTMDMKLLGNYAVTIWHRTCCVLMYIVVGCVLQFKIYYYIFYAREYRMPIANTDDNKSVIPTVAVCVIHIARYTVSYCVRKKHRVDLSHRTEYTHMLHVHTGANVSQTFDL